MSDVARDQKHRNKVAKYGNPTPITGEIEMIPPPPGLNAEAQGLWSAVISTYDIVGNGAKLATLRLWCENLTLMRECKQAIDRDGIQVEGYQGVWRPHPLMQTYQKSQSAHIQLAKSLGIHIDLLMLDTQADKPDSFGSF